jgi:hypothetical protein
MSLCRGAWRTGAIPLGALFVTTRAARQLDDQLGANSVLGRKLVWFGGLKVE